jgi:hypothetical protein
MAAMALAASRKVDQDVPCIDRGGSLGIDRRQGHRPQPHVRRPSRRQGFPCHPHQIGHVRQIECRHDPEVGNGNGVDAHPVQRQHRQPGHEQIVDHHDHDLPGPKLLGLQHPAHQQQGAPENSVADRPAVVDDGRAVRLGDRPMVKAMNDHRRHHRPAASGAAPESSAA